MSTFKKVQKMMSGLVTLFFFTSTMIVACGDSLNPPSEQEVDPEIIANTQLAERMELWINTMDPFVTQNEDWTFSLDWEAFLNAIAETDPDIIAYFHGSGEGNDDITAIETLRDGISIANVEMLTQYEASLNLPDGAKAAKWSYTYWWGKKFGFSSYDADYAIYLLSIGQIGALISDLWPVEVYLMYLTSTAAYNKARYGQFCLNMPWSVIGTWVTVR